MRHWRYVLAAVLFGVMLSPPASAQERTIFLERGDGDGSTAMTVAYHPAHGNYYASNGGKPDSGAWVYDSDGNLLQSTPAKIDVRSWSYNPNTAQLEVCSFNARGGGQGQGLMKPELDNNGLLTGNVSTIKASLPGLPGSQCMPAYDSVNDVFYARENSATVNVVKREDGSLVRSFDLSGAPGLTNYAIAYHKGSGTIVVTTTSGNRALGYDTDGNPTGEWTLDISVPSSFAMGGFAHNQLFVFDTGRNGWQGYDLGLRGDGNCNYTIKKSKAKKGCGSCPKIGDGYESEAGCEVSKDCKRRVRTTINCPQGEGSCKIKAKKRQCG